MSREIICKEVAIEVHMFSKDNTFYLLPATLHFVAREKVVHLHLDNCSSQNKNHYMMYYLMCHILVKLHNVIKISLPAGHTNFPRCDIWNAEEEISCDQSRMVLWHSQCCQPVSDNELLPASGSSKWQ